VHRACINGDKDEVSKAMRDERLVNARDALGMTPLHKLVLMGRHDLIQELVEEHAADVRAWDNMKRTPLHYAAAQDNTKCYEVLKSLAADSFIKDLWHRTPLHYARVAQDDDLGELLLKKGCDPNVKDMTNLVEVFDACARGNLKLLEQSLDRKSYALSRDAAGRTPLHVAVAYQHEDLIKYLVN
ncbi:hypothetical protein CAPTEDRAFT_44389, partial [Capitella teleta]